MERSGHPLRWLPAATAVAAWAWWVAGLRPFTWPVLAVVGATGIAAMAMGARRRRPPDDGDFHHGWALAWGVLVLLLAGWELAAWVQQPRAAHPTLSSLAGPVLDWRPARAMAFLAWLAGAAELARR